MPIAIAAPLPTRLLAFTATDGELVPAWLTDRDRPWLRDLVEGSRSFIDSPLADLTRHWRVSDGDPRAGRRQAIAQHVLAKLLQPTRRGSRRAAMRQQLFAMVASGVHRQNALRDVATAHNLTEEQLQQSLYEDLPTNRLLAWPDTNLEPATLALHANLALVRGMLRHAERVQLEVHGGSRTLLKTAWLRGAQIAIDTQSGATRLAMTGNRSSSLIALLPWTNRYHLRANCSIDRERGDLVLATGDPLQPAPEPRLFDSLLERNFAEDFTRALPDWRLIREPVALKTPHGLAFPDFELQPPHNAPSWLCEIAGLRDRRALPAKLELLQTHPRLILCLPHSIAKEHQHEHIVPFRRRVPIAAITRLLARMHDRAYSDATCRQSS